MPLTLRWLWLEMPKEAFEALSKGFLPEREVFRRSCLRLRAPHPDGFPREILLFPRAAMRAFGSKLPSAFLLLRRQALLCLFQLATAGRELEAHDRLDLDSAPSQVGAMQCT